MLWLLLLAELREQRAENEQPQIPFDDKQLLQALSITYDTGHGSDHDPEFDWDDSKLTQPEGWKFGEQEPSLPGIEPPQPHERLTEEMREDIKKAALKAFTKEAENQQDSMEPPEYLNESAQESVDMFWGEMSDKQKFNYAEDNEVFEEAPSPPEKDTPIVMPKEFDPLGEHDSEGAPKNYGSINYKDTQRIAR